MFSASVILADAPYTQPAAGSPQALVAALTNDKVADLTVDQAMAILAYDPASEKETQDAKVTAINSIAASKLEVAARKRWGKIGETAVAHAIGDNMPEDVATGDWAEDGEHAVCQFQLDGLQPLVLIKKSGQWKIDLAGSRKLGGVDLDDDLKAEQAATGIVDQLNKDVTDKSAYPTADAFAQHVKEEVAKLSQ
ncbi:MAG TPA: hypothetical protein VHY37_00980 [Tepidisphaeraceae bacterium]|nr:hypothetical protein [Tepidisphaeraceae bacterium]